jgi:hypothetical protein
MADAPHNWRIRPNATVAHQIHQLALREGRSLTGMLSRLVEEAVYARQTSEGQVDRLVATLRQRAVADPEITALIRAAGPAGGQDAR